FRNDEIDLPAPELAKQRFIKPTDDQDFEIRAVCDRSRDGVRQMTPEPSRACSNGNGTSIPCSERLKISACLGHLNFD
ncbi:hypothetical protein SB658_27735, partial [Bacillus sp. SIMBA_008]